jgi:hypothetical protein
MRTIGFIAGLCISVAVFAPEAALAQSAPTQRTFVTVDGEVVRYSVGREIVLRGADDKEVAYTLAPGTVLSEDVAIGRQVKLYTEPGAEGKPQLVTRITTTSVTPEGNVKRSTEETRKLPSGVTTSTTTTAVSGTVAAYDVDRTLTVTRADGSEMTYLIDTNSTVPADLVIGKAVQIVPLGDTASCDPVARTITYITTSSEETSGH